jgi:hypothetical protein
LLNLRLKMLTILPSGPLIMNENFADRNMTLSSPRINN